MKTEYVFGRIPVLESLRAGKRTPRRLFILTGARDLGPLREAAAGIPVEECTRSDLDILAKGGVHQGAVLEADPLPVHNADAWAKQGFPADALVVVLDGVEDPQNFGAIVRSAAACGASAVVFAKDRAAPVSPAAVKAATGAMEYIDLIRATNLVRTLDALKENDFWATALDAEADQALWQADLTGRIALVIGSEGKGIRRLVKEHCDLHLRIPLTGPITSLNASVSAAIALAECLRQRQA